jgi:integrase
VSVHKRPTKRGYTYQVRFRLLNGHQASRSFATRREAEAFNGQVRASLNGVATNGHRAQKITFGEIASLWVSSSRHRVTTSRRRDGILRNYLLPALGQQPVASIKHSDIRLLVAQWRAKGLSPQTVKNHIGILRPILDLAVRDDYIPRNPAVGLRLETPPTPKRVALTAEQCQLFLATVDDHYRPLFYFAISTGMRASELFSARVGDVDFDLRRIMIPQSKTANGVREILLSENDLLVLQQHMLRHQLSEDDSYLFPSPRGKKIQYRNIAGRVLKTAIVDSGLPSFTFHDLRRTHATMLVEAGVNPKVIQERLGHQTLELTLRLYAQPTRESRERASNVAISYLMGASSGDHVWVGRKE